MVRALSIAVALFGTLLASGISAAQDEVRIALVIGNSEYESSRIRDLANPGNDAEDVARALRGFGFEVDLKTDLDHAEMTEAMTSFAASAHSADVALFYYAGHGLQLDLRNYLVPTDAEFTTADDVINRSVPLDSLTASAEGMEGALLIFLDACQENPLGQRDGLARIPVAQNQFVALAALPDLTAADGTGRNSPFTAAFLANAGSPGQTISDVMLDVRVDVLAATGSQVPWDNSSLTQQVVLVPGDASELAPETMLWRTASSLGDPALLNVYLGRFPDGAHAEDARMLLASVESPAGGELRALTVGPEGGADGDDALWHLASTSRWPPLLKIYVERFPNGAHVEEANELIAILPDPEATDQSATVLCERLATHPNDETAAFPGVPAARLRANAQAAIESCREAHETFPDVHKYTTFLARALFVDGQTEEGVALFTEAAAAGNIRAMTTLGAFYETGTAVPPDLEKAADYYAQAAAVGADDAAVNLARMMAEGRGVPQDLPQAVSLLEEASANGSEQAAFNLGVLALNNRGIPAERARDYFSLSSDRGYIDGHFRAALLYESEELGPRDEEKAAEYLLRAVASDTGSMLQWLETREVTLSPDTVREVQRRLSELSYYTGAIDGQFGPNTLKALRVFRFGGLEVPAG